MTKHEVNAIASVRNALIKQLNRISLKEISDSANVPYGWLQQFYYGNICEPGYIKLAKLARYLKVDLASLE